MFSSVRSSSSLSLAMGVAMAMPMKVSMIALKNLMVNSDEGAN